MNEMVERVAQILAAREGAGPWQGGLLAERGRNMWREAASAAIAAMREPTIMMQRAGFEALDYRNDCDCDQIEVWQAMIDAALSVAVDPPSPT